MKYFIDLTPTTRMSINQWHRNGSVSIQIESRPGDGGCWVPSGGCILGKGEALSVGCAILNLSDNREALTKKHRWDD